MADRSEIPTETKIALFAKQALKALNATTEEVKTKEKSDLKKIINQYTDEAKFSKNALTVIKKRYLIKDEHLNPLETPKEMLLRVAKTAAKIDKNYGASAVEIEESEATFFKMLADLEFLPNSPTFTGAGTKLGQLSACFVLPLEDDMNQILKTQMHMGLIHKSGGGTGFSFSKLRPKHDVVGSTGGVSCGPLGFLQMFNDTTEQIKQGGTRRGANMGILRVDHPDIEEFIKYKAEEGTLANFNISVAMTKRFMDAVEADQEYDLINPRNQQVTRSLSARKVFDTIVDYAWKNGEPGLIFIDHINDANPTPHLGQIESTNPCGEQPLLPYESCNLAAINLAKMVKTDAKNNITIDIPKLTKTVHNVVHFLDNLIDANRYPIPEIEKMTLKTRKMGITLMGFADMLYQLGIPYDSQEGLEIAELVSGLVEKESHKASAKLAEKRGPFPSFKGSIWDKPGKPMMRNAATTSCNPTGTLSIIATCSSGIEPVFALVYTKTVMDNDALPEVNPYFLKVAKARGFYSDELIKKINEKGSIQSLDEVPDDVKRIFVVAGDISPDWHVRMQAAFQKHVDAGISKTINFPNHAVRDDVAAAYKLAHRLGCKGITIYRDGSRVKQVLTIGDKNSAKSDNTVAKEPEATSIPATAHYILPRKRPEVVNGATYRVKTGYGNMYVIINHDESGAPFEVFAHIGKTGGFFSAKAEAICRLISLALRSGIDPKEIISQIKGIRGPSPIWGSGGGMILSMADAIGQILEKHLQSQDHQLTLNIPAADNPTPNTPIATIPEPMPVKNNDIADFGQAPICPECGNLLQIGEGCLKCPSCGYSKCG